MEKRGSAFRMGAAGVAAMFIALLLIFPSVRASAQAFLDLFRVVNFTAVPVNVDRITQLSSQGLDVKQLIGDHVETLKESGPAQAFLTPEEAGASAGFRVRLPSALPPGLTLTRIEVKGEHAVRVTADAIKLQQVLDALDIHDLRAPDALNGQTATIQVPPLVHISYDYADQHVDFLQGPSPEISLPAGLDLPMLGEIGLRVLGLEPGEAHRLAQAIDWHTTLLVPVPATAAAFRQVEVHGQRGLLIETAAAGQKRALNIVLWSEGGVVHGMKGQVGVVTLLRMANSVE